MAHVQFVLVWFALFCACALASRDAADAMATNKESVLFTEERPSTDGYKCQEFDSLENRFSADGDVTILVARGHEMTARRCREYCLMAHPVRYCAAANMHVSGACYLSGYKLHKSRKSAHFRRICKEGRGCFTKLSGWRARFYTGIIHPPAAATVSQVLLTDYCRHACEGLSDCLAFDVKTSLDYCPYVQFRVSNSTQFVMHRRRCQ